MLSSVLSGERAVQVNIAIIQTFVKLRELIASNQDLAKKLAQLVILPRKNGHGFC